MNNTIQNATTPDNTNDGAMYFYAIMCACVVGVVLFTGVLMCMTFKYFNRRP